MQLDVDALVRGIDTLTFGVGAHERLPTREELGPLRFRRILLCDDGSEAARRAAAWAGHLAALYGAETLVVHVLPPRRLLARYGLLVERPEGKLHDELEAAGRDVLDRAAAELRARGVDARTILREGPPAAEIVDVATAERVDLVVLGAHGRGGGRQPLGSVARGVKNQSPASVLIAKAEPSSGPVLLPVDGSLASMRAAAVGAELAALAGASATVLHVLPDLLNDMPYAAPLQRAKRAADLFRSLDGVTQALAQGDPMAEVLAAQERGGHSLVVMGSRGLSGLESLLVGSVGSAVAQRSRASVLLVKGGA